MFIQTCHRIEENGDVWDVYRDGRDHVVTHFTAHRGGCLYIGEVVVRDDNAGPAHFAFTTTSAPWPEDTGADTAAAYYERHQDKLHI